MNNIILLQLDGGDVKGIIPAYLLKMVEEKLKCKWSDLPQLKLIAGSSTGSVIGGCLAAGIDANTIYEMYTSKVCSYFKDKQKKWFNPFSWHKPIYDRKPFYDLIKKYVGDMLFNELKIPTMITAYGTRKRETHFLKSTDIKEGQYKLADVIAWSALSAVWYFGGIKVPTYKWDAVFPNGAVVPQVGELFQDGGQGLNSCTAMYVLIEILAHEWNCEDTIIDVISIGTGDSYDIPSLKDVANDSNIRQVLNFLPQARNESMPLQVGAGNYVDSMTGNSINFHRLNCNLTKAQTEFGESKYKDLYIQKAIELEKQFPYNIFI